MVLYGDSQTFGWGLNDGERFSDLVEKETKDLEIWNQSVPGYGLDQEILSYEKDRNSVYANEVILFVAKSTISRIRTGFIFSKYKPVFVRQPSGGLTLLPVPRGRNAMISVLYRVLSPFYLPYFLQTQVATLREKFRPGSAGNGRAAPGTFGEMLLVDELAKDMLRFASDKARERNHRMALLFADLSPTDRIAVQDFCDQIGVAYMEVGPTAIPGTSFETGISEFIFGAGDGHWNARANRLIAAQLLPQINGR